MRKTPRWKKIECSRCHAPAGSNCSMESGNWNLVHSERRTAAEQVTSELVTKVHIVPSAKHGVPCKHEHCCSTHRL